jgi:hypothetical protein
MQTPIQTILAVLKTSPVRWKDLTDNLPPDMLSRKPAEGEWSVVECLQHLVDIERVFFFRLDSFFRGQDFPAFDLDKDGSKIKERVDAAELASQFAGLRDASMAALQRIGPADLERSARHQELGPVTLGQMLHEWAGHDLMHTIQAERALMQPFIEGCGPWQIYFQDHIHG